MAGLPEMPLLLLYVALSIAFGGGMGWLFAWGWTRQAGIDEHKKRAEGYEMLGRLGINRGNLRHPDMQSAGAHRGFWSNFWNTGLLAAGVALFFNLATRWAG